MRIFDAIFGKAKLPSSKGDNLIDMSSAAITLQTDLNMTSLERGAVCLKPMEGEKYERKVEEVIEGLSFMGTEKTENQPEKVVDEYGYTWLIFHEQNFDDLVVMVYEAGQAFIEQGLGKGLLCAVFPFKTDKGRCYWVYLYKRDSFYPFVPREGDKRRDSNEELRLATLMKEELHIEEDTGRWYPLWDLPL